MFGSIDLHDAWLDRLSLIIPGSDYVGTPSRSESENDRYRLQVFLFIVDKFHHVPSFFCHNSRLFEHLALLVQAHAFAVCHTLEFSES